ncbi:hypothetical protein IJG72_03650 [bacterium]|nr:hypothetical protein [bacterium]
MILLLSNNVFAQTKTGDILSRIENSLYEIEYTNQSEEKRLERIEETVYGEAKKGNIKLRLDNLYKDISANQMGQEISPKRDTFEEESETYTYNKLAKQNKSHSNNLQNNSNPNIDYPVVNELEEKAFGKTYKELDLNTRLSKLEQHSLKKTYDDAFSDRVERLKTKLAYKQDKKPFQYQYYDNYLAQNMDNYAGSEYEDYSPKATENNSSKNMFKSNNYLDKEISDADFRSDLNKIERKVFKNSYSSDSINNRLSRLENTIFNTQFNKDSNNTRLRRISSAVQAQTSARKYDSNSIQQKIGTALQIGMMVLMVVAMIL